MLNVSVNFSKKVGNMNMGNKIDILDKACEKLITEDTVKIPFPDAPNGLECHELTAEEYEAIRPLMESFYTFKFKYGDGKYRVKNRIGPHEFITIGNNHYIHFPKIHEAEILAIMLLAVQSIIDINEVKEEAD